MAAKLTFVENIDKIAEPLKNQLKSVFSEGDRIAVKLHMGELNNKYYLKPGLVKKIINVLLKLKLKPFLFESPVVYDSSRNTIQGYLETAKKHGFTKEKIGCPIIISDDFVNVKTKHLTVQVCKTLADADGVLVLSHVKGHPCTGFGAAIKNLGMGAVSKKSKKEIHQNSFPELVGECTGCGLCKTMCVGNSIQIKNKKVVFDYETCYGCDSCILNCPQKALRPRMELFNKLISESAYAAFSKFKKVFYINIIKDISKLCDCAGDAGPIIAKDVGILLGKDGTAIDKASLDLIQKQEGKEIFKEHHHKSPLIHIKHAAKLGMGEINYVIS